MRHLASLVRGLGAGAGLMFFFDPQSGRRRRALVRDKFARLVHETSTAVDKTARDMLNRTRGLLAQARSLATCGQVDDQIVAERVRSKLGWACTHPGAIEVRVQDGRASLSGPILAHEVERVLETVGRVRGVTGVDNALDVYKEPGDVPGLQGGPSRPRRGERFELMQVNWSPTARVLVGAAGAALLAKSQSRGGPIGAGYGTLGAGLLTRALTNLPFKRLFGVGAGRRAIDIQKTINVFAPLERVFEFWSSYENFPRFMAHVREVRTFNGRSHWVVSGPAGTRIEFDTVLTCFVPYQILAWKTVPGAAVRHAGIIHFEPNADGGTRIDIKMSYNPPAGALGHAVATLFGSDPKHAMDEDLVRFKSLIEQGETSAHGEKVTREEIETAVHGSADIASPSPARIISPAAPMPPL